MPVYPEKGKLYRNTKTGVVAECLRCHSPLQEYDYYVLPKGVERIPENVEVWSQYYMEPHG